jgi:extracellular elastinolytic metalloproteinase
LTSTEGNAVRARLADTGAVAAGTVQAGLVVFDPPATRPNDRLLVNLFTLNCYMHDFFYLLGFRKREGNFQRDNLAL